MGGVISAIHDVIADFRGRYPDFVFNPGEMEKQTPSGLFTSFLSACTLYSSDEKLYVMADDYDDFISLILSRDPDQKQLSQISRAVSFMRAFYAVIKAGTMDCILKTFITGVSSVSPDSFTSGFNMSLNISSDKEFNGYAGFTEEELQALIPKLVDLRKPGVTAKEIIARMDPVFGGYCFSRYAGQTVYNSSMCLRYLGMIEQSNEFMDPRKCIDSAFACDGKKLRQLFCMAENGLGDYIIEAYKNGESFFSGQSGTEYKSVH